MNKISFRISNGEKIAITGLSGSGKTTLINILLGIININRGKIIINNKALKKGRVTILAEIDWICFSINIPYR